jgi:hypothetical protein
MRFSLALGVAGLALGAASCASYDELPLDPEAEIAALWSRTLAPYAIQRAGRAGQALLARSTRPMDSTRPSWWRSR